ncbi:universal stress protein [Streptomyces indonesiensis]
MEQAVMEQVVTVGLDGSPESLAAAHWAADEAERRELALRLTHAWILLAPPTPDSPAADDQNYWAKRIVHDAHTELARDHPKLTIIEDLVADEAEQPCSTRRRTPACWCSGRGGWTGWRASSSVTPGCTP